ncbi:GNAT family N-acetyltransferase [Streptomyces sp. WI03-4A]|uniref:GNAT family N-acetyltransferase n=1 Tax=Streptomyces sp. WI03-4A TaxID=3028706 RepID=UPI0029A05FE8|nr:GNAT family N-acetyltransferase [Streptomyces sp. WI03-4A]MDX2592012.1 GNAT family N-acetyltransferase [Streptomyces sp. WI03-4A]
MNDTVILHADATPSAPALVLRPWCTEDAAALVEVSRDPALRRWTSLAVENEADALRWVRGQERGWAAGDRFSFAVVEKQPGLPDGRLMGHVVLKEVALGKPSAEVGYWTAAHARGRGVAPRALQALTTWAFDGLRAGTLEHLELLHQAGNAASCRVADKSRYLLDTVLPATPPAFPGQGHRHIRRRDT